MTPSMVGLKKMYHLPSKGSFLGYNDFLSNGPATDLFIYLQLFCSNGCHCIRKKASNNFRSALLINLALKHRGLFS